MTVFTTALMAFFVMSGTMAASSTPVQLPEIRHMVAMTAYNAVPEQTDSDPTVTASGAYTNPDIVVARSVDLADELPYGTVIELLPLATSTDRNCGLALVKDRVGLRVVADSMHSRKRGQIDILFDQNNKVTVGGKKMNPARVLGMCKGIEIRVVGFVDISRIPKTQAELRSAIGQDDLRLAVNK